MIRRITRQAGPGYVASGWRLPAAAGGVERMLLTVIRVGGEAEAGGGHGLAFLFSARRDDPIDGFEVRMVRGTWPPSEWDHANHDRTAFSMLQKIPDAEPFLLVGGARPDHAPATAALIDDDPLRSALGAGFSGAGPAMAAGPPLLDLVGGRPLTIQAQLVTLCWPRDLEADGDPGRLVERAGLGLLDRHDFDRSALAGIMQEARFDGFLRAAGQCDTDVVHHLCRHTTSAPGLAAMVYFGDTGSPSAKFRAQFAESMPVLTSELVRLPSWRNAVDNCLPLKPLLEAAGMPRAFCRRLNRLALAVSGEDSVLIEGSPPLFAGGAVEGEDALGVRRERRATPPCGWTMREALAVLTKMPIDRVPSSLEEWRAFTDVLGSVALPLRDMLAIPPERTLTMPGNVGGSWVRYRAALMTAAGLEVDEPGNRDRLALATIDCMETIDALARQVIMPSAWQRTAAEARTPPHPPSGEPLAALWEDALEQARKTLLSSGPGKPEMSGSPAARLLSVSRKAISRRVAFHEILGSPAEDAPPPPERPPGIPDDGWLPLLDPAALTDGAFTIEGCTFAPLTTRAALRREGREMDHCIGDGNYYTTQGSKGRSHFFSVESNQGRCSTLQISHRGNFGELRISQNSAPGNIHPGDRISFACDVLVDDLNAGRLPLHPETDSWRAWLASQEDRARVRRTPHRPMHEFCGRSSQEDLSSGGQLKSLWTLWTEDILGSGWRNTEASAAGIVDVPGVPRRHNIQAAAPG